MAKNAARAKSQLVRSKLGTRFDLGSIRGEDDPLLESSFLVTPDYERMEERARPSAIVIGRTGSGKSAAFRFLQMNHPDNVIMLDPVQLALPYISNTDVVRDLTARGFNLEPFFKPLWERVFVTEIIHHRYKDKTPEAKQRFLDRIISSFRSDPKDATRQRKLQQLEKMKDDFFCSTEERLQRNVETLSQQIYSEKGLNAKVFAKAGPVFAELGGGFKNTGTAQHTVEITTEERDKTQRIINQEELRNLKDMLDIIRDHVLDSPQKFTYILIDDLDQHWVDDSIRLMLLRCLFHAVMDLSAHVPNLKILVALRTNIFRQLDYGSQKYGPQEEKIENMIIHLRWTKADLVALLDQRVRAASEKYGKQPPVSLESILPNPNNSRDPIDHIIKLTLMRPRDAIQFLNTAIELAEGKTKLSYQHINMAEQAYSENRLRALRDEWRDPYFHIDKVLEKFRKRPTVMTWAELIQVLTIIATDVWSLPEFEGNHWLEPLCMPIYQTTFINSVNEPYYPLINLLYEIGFLGVSASASRKERAGEVYHFAMYCHGTGERLGEEQMTDDIRFVVHPAFHRALDMPQRWVNPN